MSTRARPSRPASVLRRLLPCAVAFLATLASSPGLAIDVPGVPLQSGAAYPPANIRFILDDSGSMAFVAMPRDLESGDLDDDPTDRSYLNNTIYYNPAINYRPWIKADGTRYSDATNVTCVTTSLTSDTGGCRDLRDNDESIFYVPKSGVTASTDRDDFDKYWIRNNGGSAEVVRITQSSLGSWTQNISEASWAYQTVNVPAGTLQLVVRIAGNTNNRGDADLYVRRTANPTTNNWDYRSAGSSDTESLTINNPQSGNWRIGVYNADSGSGNRNVNGSVLTVLAYGVEAATPTGRTQANELKNFANWYTYHRTRTKVAKAGAGEAFSNMGSNVRVGFDTIWNRNEFKIPVGTDGGVFTGTNRDTWYSRLYAAGASNGTPLHAALRRAGEYFKDASAAGPWGPETGANQLSCRQNFAILTTDGYWNSASGQDWRGNYVGGGDDDVGNVDNTNGPTITDSKGRTYTYARANPYKDSFTSTLADVAMKYWKNDLVSGLENNVPTSTADPAFWQHMVTFGVSIGLKGRLDPQTDLPYLTNGTKSWRDPMDVEDLDRIDDLWHASVNGHGAFVSASNPTEFVEGLLTALKTVEARLGSASNVTANSTSFVADTRVYQASYVSGKWTGELTAYAASASGVASTPAWTAASQISPTNRKVFTWTGSAGDTFPTSSQITALDRSTRLLSPVTGADNAAYIKGDSSKEKRFTDGVLRDRDSLLGDIVNSSPIYVKETNTIYVGANDGMLHAFNASNGAELFAYVPAGVNFSDLASLSDPQYTHKYFVDGPVVVSTQAQTPGKNYLVGALGRGGKGLFGLDVTSPSTFAKTNVKWEYTGGSNMGYVLGEPVIVTLNDASKTKAVIVGNGINSSSGHAALFVINIATGALITEIDTGVGDDNGMSAPRGWDDNGDGTVDYVYAGDLKGNLWKFDFSTSTLPTSGTKLFQTASGQPITAGLALARDPATSKRWVFVGTGKFIENGDVNDATVQSMYGIIDDGSTGLSRSDLAARDILVTTTQNGTSVRGFVANSALASDKKGWYIDLDDPTAGERIVSRPQVKGGVLVTASIIPPTDNSCEAGGSGYVNALDAFSGTSLKAPYFDMNRDGKFDANDHVTSGDTSVPIGSIDLGVGMPTLPTIIDKLLVVGGSTGSLASLNVNPQGGSASRVSWREILED
jgi:type IV pilus assembly protein PilY1